MTREDDYIEDLKNGKRHAYDSLITEFQEVVFNRCLSFVPNREDAEDIMQEVFLEVFNSIEKFKGGAKLSTWIYRITTNKCLEFIRKKSAKKRNTLFKVLIGNEIPLNKTSYFTDFNHPGIALENKERSEILFKAIHALPEAQSVVFTLHKIDGLSYKEISEITQKSLSSVESLLFRAKKNLQKALENYYKEDN